MWPQLPYLCAYRHYILSPAASPFLLCYQASLLPALHVSSIPTFSFCLLLPYSSHSDPCQHLLKPLSSPAQAFWLCIPPHLPQFSTLSACLTLHVFVSCSSVQVLRNSGASAALGLPFIKACFAAPLTLSLPLSSAFSVLSSLTAAVAFLSAGVSDSVGRKNPYNKYSSLCRRCAKCHSASDSQ